MCLNRYRNHRTRDISQNRAEDTLSRTLARLNLKEKCSMLNDYMAKSDNIYGLVTGEFNELFEPNPTPFNS
jgi:hypothetical protein